MGYSDLGSGCRRHPGHKLAPGVCSFCLRERLTRLSSGNSSYKTTSSSFSSSLSSSSPPSGRQENHHRRNGSAAAPPVGFLVHQGGGSYNNNISKGQGDVSGSGLKKSKSVTWAQRGLKGGNNGNRNGNGEKEKEEKNAKKGLWKKLVHSTSKKTKGVLMHSMTVKERSSDMNSYRRV